MNDAILFEPIRLSNKHAQHVIVVIYVCLVSKQIQIHVVQMIIQGVSVKSKYGLINCYGKRTCRPAVEGYICSMLLCSSSVLCSVCYLRI